MVTMSGIHYDKVHTGLYESRGTLHDILRHTERCTDQKPSLSVLRRVRELDGLLNILDRDEPLQNVVLIH
ncbi:hypothetical protein D3C87_2060380 [compost metagenome]